MADIEFVQRTVSRDFCLGYMNSRDFSSTSTIKENNFQRHLVKMWFPGFDQCGKISKVEKGRRRGGKERKVAFLAYWHNDPRYPILISLESEE